MPLPLVTLKPIHHRRANCIALYFEKNASLNALVLQLPQVKWSSTQQCWYLPLTPQHYAAIQHSLGTVAQLHTTALRQYLINRKAAEKKDIAPAATEEKAYTLNQGNTLALQQFMQALQLKSYSNSTIKTYRNEFLQLLQLLGKKHVNDLTTDEVKRFMLYSMQKLGISENTAHSRINALKFYFEKVLHREKFFWEIPRPKKPLQLPKLLNEDELARLFNALNNKKHKAMLFTAYSAGLRVSEIVALKITDIDSKRMVIFIERAKGKKDRYVNLSPVLLDILRSYISSYKPVPVKYLFESEQSGTAYPTRTLQQIFYNAKAKAGIHKQVGVHSLRHSFATHLLDKGTDIRYIKDLLGHFDIKTTERYLHVSKQQLVNIVSPLDDLWNKEKIDW